MDNKPSNTTQLILFLDLDGTLIRMENFDKAALCAWTLHHSKNSQEAEVDLPLYMSMESVDMVRDLRNRHNAKLGVHSNWTNCYEPEVTMNELIRHGFDASDFHQDWCLRVNLNRLSNAAPRANVDYSYFYRLQRDANCREWRIPLWLMLHSEIDNFAIFDDEGMSAWGKNGNREMGDSRDMSFTLIGDRINGPFHSRLVRVNPSHAIVKHDIDAANAILAKADTTCVWRL